MPGKYGRALLQAITNRQFPRPIRGPPTLSKELREALPWRAAVLRNAPERRAWFRGPKPVVVYLGAAGCMAAVRCDFYDLRRGNVRPPVLCLAVESWPGRSAIL